LFVVAGFDAIPFLGELLEDVEISVKSLAQEILKEMESMSGERLKAFGNIFDRESRICGLSRALFLVDLL
jgi:hypothetical protein